MYPSTFVSSRLATSSGNHHTISTIPSSIHAPPNSISPLNSPPRPEYIPAEEEESEEDIGVEQEFTYTARLQDVEIDHIMSSDVEQEFTSTIGVGNISEDEVMSSDVEQEFTSTVGVQDINADEVMVDEVEQEFTFTGDNIQHPEDDVISISSTEDINWTPPQHAVVKQEAENQDDVISISSAEEENTSRHNAVVKREHGEEEEEDEEDYNGPVFA